MIPSHLDRRALLRGLAAVSITGTIAGCGASPVPPATGPGAADAREIQHRFGTTRVSGRPDRVVIVGLVEQDAAIALGVVPVGVTEWLEAPGGILPWAEQAAANAPLPTVLSPADGIDVEAVAALQPNLIIGIYSAMTREEYDRLSLLAPTIAPPTEVNYGASWAEITHLTGQALGKADEAQSAVAGAQKQIADARAAHPQFEGSTAVVLGAETEGIYVFGTADPKTQLLIELGFTFPEALADIGKEEGSYGGYISFERTNEVDLDTVVWLMERATLDSLGGKVWSTTTAAKTGRDIFIADGSTYYLAQNMITVLSIPYLLERYVPQLTAAVDGDPNTRVPAA